MTEGLKALLGCVQGEVSQPGSAGKSPAEPSRLTEHVLIPVPADGSHVVSLVCKYCDQTIRVRVRSPQAIRKRRLASRLTLAASVCLWSAAAALLLVYIVSAYPQPPGLEVAVAGLLVALGAGLWIVVDGYDAFASDLKLGCQIERPPEENAWRKGVSREGMKALPCHVLLDAETEPAAGLTEAWAGGRPRAELRKPTVRTTVASPDRLTEVRPGQASRTA